MSAHTTTAAANEATDLPEIPGVDVTHEWHDLDFGRLHVARAGDPALPAIMLVHGFPQHWWSWKGVVQELAGEAHLVMPDLRGHGWSDAPADTSAYEKSRLAGDLVALMDRLGVDSMAVCAHDWGGWASQLAALRHPDRVRALLALSIPPVVPGPAPPLRSMLRMYYQLVFSAPGSTAFVRDTRRLARGIRQDVQIRSGFTAEDATVYAGRWRDPARAKAAQSMYRSFITGDAVATRKEVRGMRFEMPVRFVLSAHDAYIPPEFAKGVTRLGDDVQVTVQDRTGHFLPDEDPSLAARHIREVVLPHAVPIGA